MFRNKLKLSTGLDRCEVGSDIKLIDQSILNKSNTIGIQVGVLCVSLINFVSIYYHLEQLNSLSATQKNIIKLYIAIICMPCYFLFVVISLFLLLSLHLFPFGIKKLKWKVYFCTEDFKIGLCTPQSGTLTMVPKWLIFIDDRPSTGYMII